MWSDNSTAPIPLLVSLLAQEQDDGLLQEEIERAHVVCVVYDITAENALDRVSGWRLWAWLVR